MKFTEAKIEQAFIELLGNEGYPHFLGNTISRMPEDVLIEDDIIEFLLTQYKKEGLTLNEAKSIVLQLKTLPASELYETNRSEERRVGKERTPRRGARSLLKKKA